MIPKDLRHLVQTWQRLFLIFEKAVPEDYRGYSKEIFFILTNPNKEQNAFFFKPNIVQYMVKADSELGKKIESQRRWCCNPREVDPRRQ